MHAHHNIIVFVINYEINPKIYIFFARHVSWQILDTIKTFLINGCLKASIFFFKMKNLHRTGSKVGFRVNRNWVMDIKKNLVVKMNASLGSSVSDVPILTTPWHTKTQYILWSEINGLLNQLSFFGHILSLQVTIDALNSLKNFLRIGSPWVCRQPRKSWDFMISSDLDCQISRILMMKKKFFFFLLFWGVH